MVTATNAATVAKLRSEAGSAIAAAIVAAGSDRRIATGFCGRQIAPRVVSASPISAAGTTPTSVSAMPRPTA